MTSDPVAGLRVLYRGHAANRLYDEAVTQREHALQCAALADAEGAPDALVAAALLHDVGHLIAGVRTPGDRRTDDRHEAIGARHLRRIFGVDVTGPVALHVAAKRYLCADGAYAALLSPASVASLAVQGGPMVEADAHRFRTRQGWEEAVQLRRWDDRAKVAGAKTRPFDSYLPLLRRLARTT